MFGLFRTDHPTKAWDLQTHTKFYYIKHMDVPHKYTMPVHCLIEVSIQHVARQIARSIESKPFLDKTWIKVLAIISAGAFLPALNMTGLLPYVAGYLLPPLAVLLVIYQFCSSRGRG